MALSMPLYKLANLGSDHDQFNLQKLKKNQRKLESLVGQIYNQQDRNLIKREYMKAKDVDQTQNNHFFTHKKPSIQNMLLRKQRQSNEEDSDISQGHADFDNSYDPQVQKLLQMQRAAQLNKVLMANCNNTLRKPPRYNYPYKLKPIPQKYITAKYQISLNPQQETTSIYQIKRKENSQTQENLQLGKNMVENVNAYEYDQFSNNKDYQRRMVQVNTVEVVQEQSKIPKNKPLSHYSKKSTDNIEMSRQIEELLLITQTPMKCCSNVFNLDIQPENSKTKLFQQMHQILWQIFEQFKLPKDNLMIGGIFPPPPRGNTTQTNSFLLFQHLSVLQTLQTKLKKQVEAQIQKIEQRVEGVKERFDVNKQEIVILQQKNQQQNGQIQQLESMYKRKERSNERLRKQYEEVSKQYKMVLDITKNAIGSDTKLKQTYEKLRNNQNKQVQIQSKTQDFSRPECGTNTNERKLKQILKNNTQNTKQQKNSLQSEVKSMLSFVLETDKQSSQKQEQVQFDTFDKPNSDKSTTLSTKKGQSNDLQKYDFKKDQIIKEQDLPFTKNDNQYTVISCDQNDSLIINEKNQNNQASDEIVIQNKQFQKFLKVALDDFLKLIIQVCTNKWVKEKVKELQAWFIEEANSEDGLTWDEFCQMIHELAKNNNFNISDDILNQLKILFNEADLNNDGAIKLDDFNNDFKKLNDKSSNFIKFVVYVGYDQILKYQFKHLQEWLLEEVNSDDGLTWNEFFAKIIDQGNIYLQKTSNEQKDQLRKIFEKIDSNGDDTITPDDFKSKFKKMKLQSSKFIHSIIKVVIEKWSNVQLNQLLPWFFDEVNSDDGLTWEEFKVKINEVAEICSHKPSEDEWKKLKYIFDQQVFNQDQTITLKDFDEQYQSIQFQSKEFIKAISSHGKNYWMKNNSQALVNWFIEEINSEDGLTWEEFQEKIQSISFDQRQNISKQQWDILKYLFNQMDINQDKSLTLDDFKSENQSIRLQSFNLIISITQINDLHWISDKVEELFDWILEEVNTDDGLTWQEFQDKLKELVLEHNQTVNEENWKVIKIIFDKADTNSDQTLKQEDFNYNKDFIRQQIVKFVRSLGLASNDDWIKFQDKELIEWLLQEIDSEDGLTWQEFQDRIKEIAQQQAHKITTKEWKQLKNQFDRTDKNGDNTLQPIDFAFYQQSIIQKITNFIASIKSICCNKWKLSTVNDLLDWFKEELKSEDGLTWDEFKEKLGQVSKENNWNVSNWEWIQLKEIFDARDLNGDKTITLDDLNQRTIDQMGANFIQSIISVIDRKWIKSKEQELVKWLLEEVNSDDGLTWSEFKQQINDIAQKNKNIIKEKKWLQLNKLFNQADSNQDGMITVNDLQNQSKSIKTQSIRLLKSIISVITNKWMNEKVIQLDEWFLEQVNSDDGLTWDEFLEKMNDLIDEFNCKFTDDDLAQLRELFVNQDKNGDYAINQADFDFKSQCD